ncbi:hypothetical protein [Streptomyces sp. NBC_01268]|uniref:hypothetical protein n=1 Tax=unclassified Streptomyces TaxID=2593676 RepID=UPI002E36BEEA|nr:hypothetical protein [Streptomyces sp. NBC_01268]
MSNRDNQQLVWFIFGLATGFVLLAKMHAARAMPHEEPLKSVVIAGAMLGGGLLFGAIGGHLHDEVAQEKISRATYWTTVFGIAVASFTLLGITGVDDLFALFDKAG